MATIAHVANGRRTSWVPLPLKPATTMSQAEHDRAARELLRNAPEIYSTGVLQGMAPKLLTWEDTFSETEVAIIKECITIDRFDDFLTIMMELFPCLLDATEKEKNIYRKKLLLKAISLWHQISNLREE